MKDKNAAALLALFGGYFGIHRFYLGQIGWGIFYLLFFWISWLISIIDFFVFLSMDQKEFDFKYNRNYIRQDYLDRDTDFDRRTNRYQRRNRDYQEERREPYRKRTQQFPPHKRKVQEVPRQKKTNPYKLSGIRKYKDYDFEGAIEDFKKVLANDSKDVAVHFNIACAYSIMEDADKAFYHLSEAVKNGFVDFSRIHEHDALAFLRIHEEYDTFVKRGYQLEEVATEQNQKDEVPDLLSKPDLLVQLKQLGELRDKGLLTEEEFQAQKERILRT